MKMMKKSIFNRSTFLEYLNDGNTITSIKYNDLNGDEFITLIERVISSLNKQEREAKHISIFRISIDDRYKF